MHSEKIIKMLYTKKIKTLTLKNSSLNITHNKGINSEISIADIEKIYLSPKKTSLNNWIYYIVITVTIGVLVSFFISLINAVLISLLALCVIFKLLSNKKKYFLVIKFRKKDFYYMQIPTKDKTEIIKLIWDIRAIKLNQN